MKIKNFTITFFILLFSTQLFAEINEVNNNKIKILMESGVPLIDIRTERNGMKQG